ncbi:MAG: type II toxin-antitoxin system VapC family toxin [Treponema sp.]|jgi:predicted nucleic acid-binding protein|nr:type II toxin-antitoxin system VapC family toxin [Treponema sp.]
MNGTENSVVFDTNIIISALKIKDGLSELDRRFSDSERYVSVMTRTELYGFPDLKEDEQNRISDFLGSFTVAPYDTDIENETVKIRRFGTPRPKLPDAIIAATAIVLGAILVTNDGILLKLDWPGLETLSIE